MNVDRDRCEQTNKSYWTLVIIFFNIKLPVSFWYLKYFYRSLKEIKNPTEHNKEMCKIIKKKDKNIVKTRPAGSWLHKKEIILVNF